VLTWPVSADPNGEKMNKEIQELLRKSKELCAEAHKAAKDADAEIARSRAKIASAEGEYAKALRRSGGAA